MKSIAVAAITLDGRLGLDPHHFTDWTSPEDKKFLREILDTFDVIVVGNNTYKTAAKELAHRNCVVLTSSVATTERKNDKLLFWNPAGTDYSSVLPAHRSLGEGGQNYKMVGVLGGAKTYSYFLKSNILDELYLTVEPIVFGRGVSLFDHPSGDPSRFKLLSMKKLNDTGSVLLHYEITR